MTENLCGVFTPGEIVERYEQASAAVKAYSSSKYRNRGSEQRALKDLKAYAERLSEGSTIDMVQSSVIDAACSRYLMAKEYKKLSQDNPLYTEEMNDWFALEKELDNYGGSLAYIMNWGGSLARVINGGFAMTTADERQKSYSQLHRGGAFAASQITLDEACASFRLAVGSPIEPDEYLMDDPGYTGMITEMQQSGERLQELFDKWLASHCALCESEGVPESHTAAFVQSLTDNILRLTVQ